MHQENSTSCGKGAACTGGEPLMGASGDTQDFDKTKLIINYIPQFATEEDLAEIFAPIGRVENIKIMRDYKTGYSFGFGFVKYSTAEESAKAIQLLNGLNYKNKRLKVSYSRPPGADMKDSNLYITNLPKDVTEQDVQNLFCDYGEIVQKSVLKDKVTGMPRGVAFVRFSKGEEAQAAIANLDGKLLDNAVFPLSVRVAEDHGRQKAQYLDNWSMPMHNRGPAPFRGGGGGGGGMMPPFRKMPPPTGMPPEGFRNSRFQGFHHTNNNVRNMGAGDTSYLQNNPFYL